MRGCWLQLFNPRVANDVEAFLPENVSFSRECSQLNEAIRAARAGELRLFLECPSAVEGVELGNELNADSFKARSVVADEWFGIPVNRILTQHNFVMREVMTPVKAHLVAARVAGYRDACFGLDDAEQRPLLFEHPQCSNIMIAVTPFSSFVTSRFAPACDWKLVMGRILGWLSGRDEVLPVDYELSVRPAYSAKEPLPKMVEEESFKRNAEWFYREMIYFLGNGYGIMEGYTSTVDVTGRQWVMAGLRGDCLGECAAVGALDFAINREQIGSEMARGLLYTLFETPKVRDCCPASQTFGSLFFDTESHSVYGDDNSRSALGAILAEELLDDPKHVKELLQLGYSLLRTTGPNGLREPALLQPIHFQNRTWKYYHTHTYTECHPHYQAWHWALNLELYALSGDRRFLDSAKAALDEADKCFPDFYWQNGATGDWARILLPYAMLVEVEDTPENRKRLERVAMFFIGKMNEFHVVPEVMGRRDLGHYPSPTCNADHGKGECALVQFNGDPVCDLLYSINFAFPGMHEAYMATGDERYKKAADELADFLCRIQVRSQNQPYLDGCWLHGFDFNLWEHFGSSADIGWGPWCVETGWTNSWIATTLALRKLGRPLLSVKAAPRYRELADEVAKAMFEPMLPSTTTRGTTTEIHVQNLNAFAEE